MINRSFLVVAVAFAMTGSAGRGFAEVIHLKTRSVDPSREPDFNAVGPARLLRPERRHLLAEFSKPIDDNTLHRLALNEAIVTGVIGQRSLAISVPANVPITSLGVAWAGTLNAKDKLSPELAKHADASIWLVEFHKDVIPEDQTRIITDAGFSVMPGASPLPSHRFVTGDRASLPALAAFDEVAYILPAPSGPVSAQEQVPCAGALTNAGTAPDYVLMSTGWPANASSGVVLSYVFAALTTQLPAASVQSEIERAMQQWSAFSSVQFVPGTDTSAAWTVAIEFGTSVNGDPTPFTSLNTLAHTYYPAPPNPEPIAGDLHFNPAETWNIGSTTDVYTVALHELGHALGLGHTDNPADVMYPYYHFGGDLSASDIAGVQALYGPPPAGETGPNPPSSPPPSGGTSAGEPAWSRIPMVVAVSSPANGYETSASSVAITGSVLNAQTQPTVTWQTDSGASGTATGGAIWNATVPLIPGWNTVAITAVNANQRNKTRLLQILCTAQSPSTSGGNTGSSGPPSGTPLGVTITSPADGTVTAADAITLTGTANDPEGVQEVTWQTGSFASGSATGTMTWTAVNIPLFPGPNVLVVQERNNSGGTRWTSVTINKQ